MNPIGFVICNKDHDLISKDKIYPYFEICDSDQDGDCRIAIWNDDGKIIRLWMFLDKITNNQHYFDFYFYPEFPKDTKDWTEEDWFQYHLKYG